MHILVTTDTVGGVWTYTQELVTGLVGRGHRVTLISLGEMPTAEQTSWLSALSQVDYRPTAFRLEWMQDSYGDIAESSSYLSDVIKEVRPDVLHFNQYCYGSIKADIPKIVVAHSDVVSWWLGVHGCEPDDSPWITWYREIVTRGLRGADMVVAPSQWMLNSIRATYVRPTIARVIYNGRTPSLFTHDIDKRDFVLSVGRLWDAAKQVSLLTEYEQSMPVCIVGPEEEPGTATSNSSSRFMGAKSHLQLRTLFSEAVVYAGTSRYEPFGLAPLEAALSRCALIMNDLPVFRELWEDSAVYFSTNDACSLAGNIARLAQDPNLREEYAERAYQTAVRKFNAKDMVVQYENMYSMMYSAERVA